MATNVEIKARVPDPEGLEQRAIALAGSEAEILRQTDVFFRVPGQYDLPKHWHTSAERMVLVEGRLSVTYDGQPAVVLEPGTYAYGPAKAPHLGRCVSDGPCTLFIAFEQPVDATQIATPAKP